MRLARLRLRAVLPLAVLLAAAAAPAAGQVASLVRDLNPALQRPPLPRRVGPYLTVDRKIFFLAKAEIGNDLWVSDGTALGTRLLKADLLAEKLLGSLGNLTFFFAGSRLWRSDGTRPGTFAVTPEQDFGLANVSEEEVAFLGGVLYFAGCTPAQGCELWRSDGTREGTRMVADVGPGAEHGTPLELTVVSGRLFFLPNGHPNGFLPRREIWSSDGTREGTALLHRTPSPLFPADLTAAAGRLFFRTVRGAEELWGSDGTPAGTRMLARFAGPVPFLRVLAATGSRLYFLADDGIHGLQVWRSDGTVAGTGRVTAIDLPEPSQIDLLLAEVGGRLLVAGRTRQGASRLWSSGGTPAATVTLVEEGVSRLVEVNGRALFQVSFPLGIDDERRELWASDGTAAGTGRLVNVCSRSECHFPLAYLRFGDHLVFETGGQLPEQLWISDGTRAGTRRHGDVNPFREVAGSGAVGAIERTFFFSREGRAGDHELWVADGTAAGTHAVTTLDRWALGADFRELVPLGDELFFTAAFTVDGPVLWRSAGSAESTVPAADASALALTPSSGSLFFLSDGVAPGLYHHDGTGVVRLTDDGGGEGFLPGAAEMASLHGGRVLFSRRAFEAGVERHELWTSDGTAGGTRSLRFLGSAPASFVAVGGIGYFVSLDLDGELQVWRSDGTEAGTRQLARSADLHFFDFDSPQALGPFVYFRTPELWRMDGVTAAQVFPDSHFTVEDLAAHGGALYFQRHVTGGSALWRWDGTAAPAVQLGTFPEDRFPAPPLELTSGGRYLYFVADDGVHGSELWRSDGSAAGTVMVRDIWPGALSSQPRWLTVAGDRLFFAAGDPVHGVELWESDGTEAGTRLVQDIAPEASSSFPARLIVAGDRLYFSADDGLTGDELWSLALGGTAACRPAPTRLCLGGGRFAVEATWRDFQDNRGAGRAVALTTDTGYFWFFDPANVEVVLKVLDGRGFNEHFWVFYGALSSVGYDLTVTDTQTGLSRRYFNPAGQLASVADTAGFGPLGAYASAATTKEASAAPVLVMARTEPAVATGICVPGADRLCLGGGRFAVEATWKDFQGHQGSGQAVALTADTGYFWFFGPDNVEVVLKVLDGRPVNGKHWVFYGALSSVEYELTVTDVETGVQRVYRNPSGRLASGADTGAF